MKKDFLLLLSKHREMRKTALALDGWRFLKTCKRLIPLLTFEYLYSTIPGSISAT